MSVEDHLLGVTRYVMPAAPSVGVRHQDVSFSPFCLPLVVPAALAQTDRQLQETSHEGHTPFCVQRGEPVGGRDDCYHGDRRLTPS